MIKKYFVSLFTLISLTASGEGCFPENDLAFFANDKSNTFNEVRFRKTIQKFTAVWSPKIQDLFGKLLLVEGRWDAPKIQAYATLDMQDNLQIIINGGMARHPEMHEDALMLILCHELGHHLGGAPKAFRGTSERRSWSSAEGQADYFATSKCLKKIFHNEEENKLAIKKIPRDFTDRISDKFAGSTLTTAENKCQSAGCIRIAYAALSTAKMFATLKIDLSAPKLNQSDKAIVDKTNYGHPSPQCRLDTYLSGFRCDQDPNLHFDNLDPKVGACFRASNAFDTPAAARPLCWYRPQAIFR